MQASLKFKEEAVQKYFKPRPIPYALCDKVADEIKRLEKQGILEKIKFSEWGAPIVPVMKPDGSVRICGDYKVTINSSLEAYQQLLLCENSRNLVTINTHLGIYRYTRLPFGAASSPAIFQEFMDKVLEGLDGVGCILDDLIITGKSDEEHLKNLELVLKRLSEYGKLLSSTKVLAHYDPNVNVELAVDASPYGLGCVISHKYENGEERPIAYASRTLTSAERNYLQIEREALAIIFGVTRFHQYLYGRKFTLVTDNKPLSLLLGPKTGIPMLAASRIQRWAIQLSGYQYDVKCKSSSENANADGLSRLPLKETLCESPFNIFWEEVEIRNVQALNELPVSANNIKRETEKDSTLVKVKHATLYGWPKYTDISNELKPYFRVKDELSMEEGCLLRGIRVIIPERYRADVLNELYVNHPRIVRMKGLARMHVWWPNLDTDIEITVRNCTACQNTQFAPPAATANPWIWPSNPWQRVHIDFCGPFLNEMFLIVVDAHSKWIDVIRMSSKTSEKTINALRCLFSSHGIPTEIVSDNGPQFTSSEFETFLKKNGVKHILSAPYHPSSNGEAERAVRTFKQAMKTVKNESGTLSEKLCRFLLGYRTTPHSTTRRTPAELFVGRRLRTRLDALKPNINERMQRQRSKTKPCRDIAKGEPVLVRDYRDNNKWKQGVIVHKLGPVTYQVQVGDLVWKRHIDQIREFVPQENKDIPNILENTKSDIDTELIIVPTCNSNRDTENSENNNESERTKITENKTVENAN
ncbi:unnamed protein product [Mytilus coruscus]|uniref:Integrase catalytic domain-containing protein n=1 Tax=Mytilus coruscus TaxID=42192 RepID=A0A6J8BEA3_MYTCO|nr:unnamed protein product [Mytilus coruscus]